MRSWDVGTKGGAEKGGDGLISQRECLVAFKKLCGAGELWYSHARAAALAAFCLIDKDGSGSINVKELCQWLDPQQRRLSASGERQKAHAKTIPTQASHEARRLHLAHRKSPRRDVVALWTPRPAPVPPPPPMQQVCGRMLSLERKWSRVSANRLTSPRYGARPLAMPGHHRPAPEPRVMEPAVPVPNALPLQPSPYVAASPASTASLGRDRAALAYAGAPRRPASARRSTRPPVHRAAPLNRPSSARAASPSRRGPSGQHRPAPQLPRKAPNHVVPRYHFRDDVMESVDRWASTFGAIAHAFDLDPGAMPMSTPGAIPCRSGLAAYKQPWVF